MTNFLFLDVDGVMNCLATAIAFKHGYSDQHWSPVSVGLLRDLVERVDGKIVIISTKRKKFQSEIECIMYFKNLLKEVYDWPDAPIIGRTPSLGSIKNKLTQLYESRGYEIDSYLKAQNQEENYVIIDDNSDFKPDQFCKLVTTTFANGFDLIAYNKCLSIFNMPNNDINIHAQNALQKYGAYK